MEIEEIRGMIEGLKLLENPQEEKIHALIEDNEKQEVIFEEESEEEQEYEFLNTGNDWFHEKPESSNKRYYNKDYPNQAGYIKTNKGYQKEDIPKYLGQ